MWRERAPGCFVAAGQPDHQGRLERGSTPMLPLGPNGHGEYLQPGRVTDCYLGILLDQPLAEIAPEPGSVLVVAPAALLHRQIPSRTAGCCTTPADRPPRPGTAGAGVPRGSHRGAAGLAAADLDHRGCQPRGGPAAGGGPLARRPGQGVGAWRGERRGGPRARPPTDGLCACAAPRAACRRSAASTYAGCTPPAAAARTRPSSNYPDRRHPQWTPHVPAARRAWRGGYPAAPAAPAVLARCPDQRRATWPPAHAGR